MQDSPRVQVKIDRAYRHRISDFRSWIAFTILVELLIVNPICL